MGKPRRLATHDGESILLQHYLLRVHYESLALRSLLLQLAAGDACFKEAKRSVLLGGESLSLELHLLQVESLAVPATGPAEHSSIV